MRLASIKYMKSITFIVFIMTIISCSATQKLSLHAEKHIDYSNPDFWASLPEKDDPSDLSPERIKPIADGGVDIFFLYPTSLLSKKDRELINAPIDYKRINAFTDKSSIKYQASIFNQVGKVYAPRYRQAHIYNYYSKDREIAKNAFELAYQDVKDAFEFYLKHYNHGRPIIIAGHSQGTTHGMRLLKEYFDGKPLMEKLVVAYLPGIPIPKDLYTNISICTTPNDLECVSSWRTFKYGYEPRYISREKPMIMVNPLTWNIDTTLIGKSFNKGAVFKKFDGGILKERVDAQIHGNILWVHKPKFPWSFLFTGKNYHIADFNFFYLDVRENAKHRRDLYLSKNEN